jgi:hypothetical protein
MKTLTLLFPIILALFAAPQTAPPQAAPSASWLQSVIPLTAETPYGTATVYAPGQWCMVELDGRWVGPLAVAGLPALPGQQSATAGTTLCVARWDETLSTVFYSTQAISGVGSTMGAAVQSAQQQIQSVLADPMASVEPMSECTGGQG